MKTHCHNSNGFTLVEVLLALSLMSLILLVLYSSLFTTSKSLSIGTEYIDSNNEYRLVHTFLRQIITKAQPLMRQEKDGNRLLVTLKSDRFGFTATLPSHRGGGGLYYIELSNHEKDGLVLHYYPVDSHAEDGIRKSHTYTNERVVLFTQQVRFHYFGHQTNYDKARWHNDWDSLDKLPQLVKFDFTDDIITHRERHYLPELTFVMPTHFSIGRVAMVLLVKP